MIMSLGSVLGISKWVIVDVLLLISGTRSAKAGVLPAFGSTLLPFFAITLLCAIVFVNDAITTSIVRIKFFIVLIFRRYCFITWRVGLIESRVVDKHKATISRKLWKFGKYIFRFRLRT